MTPHQRCIAQRPGVAARPIPGGPTLLHLRHQVCRCHLLRHAIHPPSHLSCCRCRRIVLSLRPCTSCCQDIHPCSAHRRLGFPLSAIMCLTGLQQLQGGCTPTACCAEQSSAHLHALHAGESDAGQACSCLCARHDGGVHQMSTGPACAQARQQHACTSAHAPGWPCMCMAPKCWCPPAWLYPSGADSSGGGSGGMTPPRGPTSTAGGSGGMGPCRGQQQAC